MAAGGPGAIGKDEGLVREHADQYARRAAAVQHGPHGETSAPDDARASIPRGAGRHTCLDSPRCRAAYVPRFPAVPGGAHASTPGGAGRGAGPRSGARAAAPVRPFHGPERVPPPSR
ncbi:hypothetical protein GCM10010261_26850 [Streptomyces pilosus]|nr:hypothetical protein GCM10010261_26850 [Streptomyces pilosus]